MTSSTTISARRIAIIGAGACGMAAAKYLKAEQYFSTVVIYEQRSQFGGLWNYTSSVEGDGLNRYPQTNSHQDMEKPIATDSETSFLSPMYDSLKVNLPRQIMQFSDNHFSDELPMFPGHRDVLSYLQDYGADVVDMVKFSTQVRQVILLTSVSTTNDENQESWRIESENLTTGKISATEYDAVVVANGHYSVPRVPSIPGMSEWNQAFPGSIIHSKYYRGSERFRDARVVVVGSHASGLDISAQLLPCCKQIYLSQRSISDMVDGYEQSNCINIKKPIARMEHDKRSIIFEDGSVEEDIDAIIFCTGYFYSFPFLSKKMQQDLITDGSKVHGTYQHIFSIDHPSLSFMVLLKKIITFPLAEMQAAVIARVYAGRLSLPPTEHMRAWESVQISAAASSDSFHQLPYPRDADYMDMLVDWASSADCRQSVEANKVGKLADKWSPTERCIRENISSIRKGFVNKTKKGEVIRTFADMGFDIYARALANSAQA